MSINLIKFSLITIIFIWIFKMFLLGIFLLVTSLVFPATWSRIEVETVCGSQVLPQQYLENIWRELSRLVSTRWEAARCAGFTFSQWSQLWMVSSSALSRSVSPSMSSKWGTNILRISEDLIHSLSIKCTGGIMISTDQCHPHTWVTPTSASPATRCQCTASITSLSTWLHMVKTTGGDHWSGF